MSSSVVDTRIRLDEDGKTGQAASALSPLCVLVTGGTGFIGSHVLRTLLLLGFEDLLYELPFEEANSTATFVSDKEHAPENDDDDLHALLEPFAAAWKDARLSERSITVLATCRRANDPNAAAMKQIEHDSNAQIARFLARTSGGASTPPQRSVVIVDGVDLLEEDSAAARLTAAMRGELADCKLPVTHVVHLAAVASVASDPKTTIFPAINGTFAVLRAISASPSVVSVGMTSSVAAVRNCSYYRSPADPYTEKDWPSPNDVSPAAAAEVEAHLKKHGGSVKDWLRSDLDIACQTEFAQQYPYPFCKMYSELVAREWIAELQSGGKSDDTVTARDAKSATASLARSISLCTFCPSMVVGPQLMKRITDTNTTLSMLVSKKYAATPRIQFDWVDVRRVALMHVQGVLLRSNERVLCTGHLCWQQEGIEILRQEFPRATLPSSTFAIPKPVVFAISLFDKRINTKFVRERVNIPHCAFDSKRFEPLLGCFDVPLKVTIRDAALSFGHYGIVNNDFSTGGTSPASSGLVSKPVALVATVVVVGAVCWYRQWLEFAEAMLMRPI